MGEEGSGAEQPCKSCGGSIVVREHEKAISEHFYPSTGIPKEGKKKKDEK